MTRHPAWMLVELGAYGAVLWLLTDPSRLERVVARAEQVRARLELKLEALDTLAQIRDLPER
jgi:hypothetical protein